MQWTDDQRKVLETRQHNLLVSAAAGSGKTAVLTERLLRFMTDADDPANIDEFLIVTFTKAAAAEMKERIGRKITAALEEDPENAHLQRQLSLLNRAHITTIDGFCTWVLRSYASRLGIDMGFRVGEAGELKLLRADVMDAVMREAHASEDEAFVRDFRHFLETFAGKNDAALEKAIERVYDAARSQPYPAAFYRLCRESNHAASPAAVDQAIWMAELHGSYETIVGAGALLSGECRRLFELSGAPSAYAAGMLAYCDFFEALKGDRGLNEASRARIAAFEKPGFRGKRPKKDEDPFLKERMDAQKKAFEAYVDELQGSLSTPPEEIARRQELSSGPLDMLVLMAERFGEAFAEAKRRKNIVDFSDLEHLALSVLRENHQRTEAALEIGRRFREVMIDEYQDSNYLQEEILTAVSGIEDGRSNYFCVGDVKQSIYRFRQARPELFMQKFHDFGREDGGLRIDLHSNFRSRPEILRGVNTLFGHLMREEVGGITYDETAALAGGNTGSVLLAADGTPDTTVDILPMISKEENAGAEGEEISLPAKEMEARLIAEEIRRLVDHEMIEEVIDGQVLRRPVRYGDIAILLRSLSGWAPDFARILGEADIPAAVQQKSGFFSAYEVTTMLDLLSVIDNPRQDIPLAAVLTSPIVRLSAEDLAAIRTVSLPDDLSDTAAFCDRVEDYADHGTDTPLKGRLRDFLESLADYRRRAACTPIHELMSEILDETGFGLFAAALPGGQQREINLNALIEKAVAYEKTSYVGLFNFVRYIRKLERFEEDVEVASGSSVSNAVQLVSIHKSKGLEYPIVFVSGLGKKFNRKDLYETILIHPELGLASDYHDLEHRLKVPTMKKNAVRRRLEKEMIGEELRILYVAMTRAKLKLYLTGTLTEEACDDAAYPEPDESGFLSPGYLVGADTAWKLILPAYFAAKAEPELPFRFIIKRPSEAVAREVIGEGIRESRLHRLMTYDAETVADPAVRQLLEERFSWRYGYTDSEEVPVKVSVSDIKLAHMTDEEAVESFAEAAVFPLVPDFMKTEEDSITGSARGTIYHRLLSRLNLCPAEPDETYVRAETARLVSGGFLTEEEAAVIRPSSIVRFLKSDLGRRMAAAQKDGRLHREQPFTLRKRASEVNTDWSPGEEVLIQGIIDAYFEEGDDIILMDYKTDVVDTPETLIARYRVQLQLYAEALEGATGRRVPEMWLYAFRFGKAVKVERGD